jgi:pimeloyl-ACP methyl ester carboxylesterase
LVVTVYPDPVAILVLVPGCNGDGEAMATDANWLRFAEEKRLMLVGLSFASEINALHNGTGYYYAAEGSGKLLLDALDRLTAKPLPVLLYGFSGGAHFTARFAEWRPGRVAAWCAYSAGWWDAPAPSASRPFGIVACGESDERLGASLFYFKAGRAVGRPWLWVGVPGSAHVEDARVAAFARETFAAVLDGMRTPAPPQSGGWVDIEDKTAAAADLPARQPTLAGWLPDMALFPKWKALMVGATTERE